MGMEHIEVGLAAVVSLLKLLLEWISALCILLGLVKTVQLAIAQKGDRFFPFLEVRLCFGTWLAFALEFQLGADILGTTIAPSFEELGKLGLIAVIRTFLNYFLNQELETETNLKERMQGTYSQKQPPQNREDRNPS